MLESLHDPRDDSPQGQIVYHQLLDEIGAGTLLPGQRLREVELAARLGLSRTPIREAIRLMEAEGLVSHLPRQGASLRRLSYPEVMELYEMRMVLEGSAARLAARMANSAEIEQLIALNEDFAQTQTQDQAAALNKRFHLMLFEAARNRFLMRALLGLKRTLLLLGPTTLFERERSLAAAKEHALVLEAIAARDGARAELMMRAHMEAAQIARLKILQNIGTIQD